MTGTYCLAIERAGVTVNADSLRRFDGDPILVRTGTMDAVMDLMTRLFDHGLIDHAHISPAVLGEDSTLSPNAVLILDALRGRELP